MKGETMSITYPTLFDWLAIAITDADKTKIYYEAWLAQIMFVRDSIGTLFSTNAEEYRSIIKVVEVHTSKSTKLPVYHFEYKGVKFWFRGNYYNWNISVDGRVKGFDLNCPLIKYTNYDYCYCEGMEKHKFPPPEEDKRRYTMCLDTNYELYTFLRYLRWVINEKA